MQMKLSFLGAAQNVTGSRHLLEVDGTRLLVDCGLYQERQFKARNWEPFHFPAASIDAVISVQIAHGVRLSPSADGPENDNQYEQQLNSHAIRPLPYGVA